MFGGAFCRIHQSIFRGAREKYGLFMFRSIVVVVHCFCTAAQFVTRNSVASLNKKRSNAAFDWQIKTLKLSSCSAVVVKGKINSKGGLGFCSCCALPM